MKKLSAILAVALFFSFTGLMSAQTQEAKKVDKDAKKTTKVVKVKKDKGCCADKSKCTEKEKKECKEKAEKKETEKK